MNQALSLPAVQVCSVSHCYGERRALDGLDFSVGTGEIFGLLGPNGGGKTTLFRLLATLLPLQSGQVRIFNVDPQQYPGAVRRMLGVTFQSPSLDRKLTVQENLTHQGHLYGLHGRELRSRIDRQLANFGLADRRRDRVEVLSGGLQRRVEIAKSLLHQPRLLLLDEPSTGLDPGARLDLWHTMQQLSAEQGVTVLLTTHLMDEAERCHRLGILDSGRLAALGAPAELRAAVGGDCVTIQGENPGELSRSIQERFGLHAQLVGNLVRVESPCGPDFVRELMELFRDEIQSVSLGKPTLEDVFIQRTGHQFWDVANADR